MISIGPYESADEGDERLADDPLLQVSHDADRGARTVYRDVEVVGGRIGPGEGLQNLHPKLVAALLLLLLLRERPDSDAHGGVAHLGALAEERVAPRIRALLEFESDRPGFYRVVEELRRMPCIGGE